METVPVAMREGYCVRPRLLVLVLAAAELSCAAGFSPSGTPADFGRRSAAQGLATRPAVVVARAALRVLAPDDDGLLVIDKQCGQRMDGDFPGTIEKLVADLPHVDKFRPVHQLDFATSGVLLLGLSKTAAARARKAFDSGRVRKCYLALLEGHMAEAETVVDVPIARYEGTATLPPRGAAGTHRGAADFRMMAGHGSDGNTGKAARTRIVNLGTGLLSLEGAATQVPCTKVAMFPYTGRRHQLRVHGSHIGAPIIGDWTYGDRGLAETLPRMFLHAWKLQMQEPGTSAACRVWTAEDPLPPLCAFDPVVPSLAFEDAWAGL